MLRSTVQVGGEHECTDGPRPDNLLRHPRDRLGGILAFGRVRGTAYSGAAAAQDAHEPRLKRALRGVPIDESVRGHYRRDGRVFDEWLPGSGESVGP